MLARIAILLLLIPPSASGQSIVTSGGGRSIVLSGVAVRAEPVQITVPAKPSEADALRMEIDVLKSSLAAATAAPPIRKVPSVPATTQPVETRERWLVSESWCPHCPAAKARFLQSGGQADHVITIAEAKRRHGMSVSSVPYEYTTGAASATSAANSQSKPVVRQSLRKRLPVVRTQWGTIDLETYNRNCNCPMCQGIRALQRQYRQQYNPTSLPAVSPEQEPTPDDLIDKMLDLMQLTSADVLADIGCGDGRILIAAVERSGCKAIGIEIDPVKADEARRSVEAAGLSGRIEVITGEALEFDPESHGVTAITAYLYPELLQQLTETFKSPGVRIVATPFHQVPGLVMQQSGDVWSYQR